MIPYDYHLISRTY